MCHRMTECLCESQRIHARIKIDIHNENVQLHLTKINSAMILAIAVVEVSLSLTLFISPFLSFIILRFSHLLLSPLWQLDQQQDIFEMLS